MDGLQLDCNLQIGRLWRSLMLLRVRILGVIGEAQSESFLIPSTKNLEWHERFPDQISKVMQSVL